MRQTLVLSEDSWHVKLYRFWQRYAEYKTHGYQENLCHYWRCVLFWAPFRALVSYPIAGVEWLVPGAILAVLALVAFLAVALVLWPISTLAVLGMIVGILGAAALITWISQWCVDNPRRARALARKWLWSWFQYIARPVAWAAKKFAHGVVWVAGSILELMEPETWAMIFALIGAAAFLTALVVLIVLEPVAFGIAFLCALVSISLAAGLVLGIRRLVRRKSKKPEKPYAPGMARVSYEYMVSGKHKICPFIKIESSE